MYKGMSIPYESTLERDFFNCSGFLDEVKSIVPQPVSVNFEKWTKPIRIRLTFL